MDRLCPAALGHAASLPRLVAAGGTLINSEEAPRAAEAAARYIYVPLDTDIGIGR